MKRCVAAAMFLLATAFAWPAPAMADELQNLLSKYLAWRGGSHFQALQSVHERGQIRVGEVDGSFQRWLARDGRLRQDRALGPLRDSEAVTATSNWRVNASGQREALGDQGQQDRRTIALAFADLCQERAGMRCQLIGTELSEGRTWSVVRVGFGGNDSYDLFLDAATGELQGERITQDRATSFLRFGDWRTIAGVRMAFTQRVTSSNPGATEVRTVDAVELDTALSARLFAPPAPRRIWSFSSAAHSTGWIPFEFYRNEQIFIPATVNGRSTSLVLDSGADTTILDQATASSIGAKLSGYVPVGGTGGQSTMQLAPNVEVRIGGLALHDITAGVIDLSAMSSQLGHSLPMILGKEVFNQLVVDIDFPNSRIAFRERVGHSIPRGAVRVPLGRHGENRTVPVSIEGRDPVDFDFDLGSNSPAIVYPYYRDSTQLLAARQQSRELSAGVGGMFRPVCATLKSLAIGGLSLTEVPADFPDPANSAVNSDRMGGNIGLPVFSRFRLITDYARDEIWLAADASSMQQPFLRNRAGIIALPAGDRLRVLMVAPGSPAEQGGWKEGMEIKAIDGHGIDASYRTSPLSHWATQAAGTHVALTMTDDSTREIILADYY